MFSVAHKSPSLKSAEQKRQQIPDATNDLRNTAANQLLPAAYDGSSSGKLGQDIQEKLTTPLWTLLGRQLHVATTKALRIKEEE